MLPVVPVAQWGRDHWSTLLYFESRAVDYKGLIDNEKMRTNARLHRKLLGNAQMRLGMTGEKYPTHLRDGSTLDHHDDWSCAQDMMAHGLIERIVEGDSKPGAFFGGGTVRIKLTDLGWRVASTIRRDRANSKPTAQWVPLPELEAEITAAATPSRAHQP
jgi:hypothetical protein